ncbi:MAG TPA: ATP-binding protein [Casimicrobiaceae bacterium]|nr:ATP-binding protein [Casimicrobiaceae bacterium]
MSSERAVQDANGRCAVVHAGTWDNLPRFLEFIDDVCAKIDADEGTRYALRLAVEEVCINLIEYGYKNRREGPIEVTAIDASDRVTLVIVDRAPPFDPDDAPTPDLTSDAEHRKPGGLGWHLVKQLIDEIRYVPGTLEGNVLTLVKHKQSTMTMPRN